MAVKNMWGDINDMTDIRPPHEIIEEQGNILSEMTKGVLQLKIERKQSNTVFNYDIYIELVSVNYKTTYFPFNTRFQTLPCKYL